MAKLLAAFIVMTLFGIISSLLGEEPRFMELSILFIIVMNDYETTHLSKRV